MRIHVTGAFGAGVIVALGSPSFLCVLGSRMFINMKEAGQGDVFSGNDFRDGSRTISDIRFV